MCVCKRALACTPLLTHSYERGYGGAINEGHCTWRVRSSFYPPATLFPSHPGLLLGVSRRAGTEGLEQRFSHLSKHQDHPEGLLPAPTPHPRSLLTNARWCCWPRPCLRTAALEGQQEGRVMEMEASSPVLPLPPTGTKEGGKGKKAGAWDLHVGEATVEVPPPLPPALWVPAQRQSNRGAGGR